MESLPLFSINWWEFIKETFEWTFAFIWLIFKILLPAWPLALLAAAILAIKYFLNRKPIGKELDSKPRRASPEVQELARLLENYGWKPELEKWDGFKHIDIAITQARVNIEVDGRQHNRNAKQALADLKRTYYSFKKGYLTLRIPNVLVHDATVIQETAEFIDKFLRENNDQLNDPSR